MIRYSCTWTTCAIIIIIIIVIVITTCTASTGTTTTNTTTRQITIHVKYFETTTYTPLFAKTKKYQLKIYEDKNYLLYCQMKILIWKDLLQLKEQKDSRKIHYKK